MEKAPDGEREAAFGGSCERRWRLTNAPLDNSGVFV